jgi:hypothetical protein
MRFLNAFKNAFEMRLAKCIFFKCILNAFRNRKFFFQGYSIVTLIDKR